jgi:putative transposase
MARIVIPGLSSHLIRRGVNRCHIFHDDDDHRVFLAIFWASARDTRTRVHAFVLMLTHYHALVTAVDADSLAAMMKAIGERYVEYFNRRYGRIGTLWTGRYRAIPIPNDRYWLNCLRYIEQNPVRAHLVSRAAEYEWSSYRANAFGARAAWRTEHPVYAAIGSTPQERQEKYRSMCEQPLTDEEIALQRRPPAARVRVRPTIHEPAFNVDSIATGMSI